MLPLSKIHDNDSAMYTANVKLNVNNSIIMILILKTNTSTKLNHKLYF